ncbi:N-acetylmuramoyl-L-alanine amidase family protein [Priestia megaterium]|uniref:N-acetylmuramoyl-L-alanine amidase family protein n=1 Tax=Priestia megaterium TaxID=1404 RepID=UPI0015CF3E8E|nr:N-acetylmuramoyl-L-alanine amidase [Priestia megaterium]
MTKKYKVGIDGGHGMETAGKRTPAIAELGGRVIRENEFNDAVAVRLQKALARCGFDTMFTAPETSDTPLGTRVKRANASKVDILVSLHYNAITASFATAKASGFEVLAGSSSDSKRLAKCILDSLVGGTEQKNRGIKDGSWLALNKCKMPLALVEYGFMDNKKEALLMIDPAFLTECAEETAKGICKYFGVTYKAPAGNTPAPAPAPSKPAPKPTPTPSKPAPKKDVYRVIVDGKQVGAYAEGSNLLEQARKSLASGAKNIRIEKA